MCCFPSVGQLAHHWRTLARSRNFAKTFSSDYLVVSPGLLVGPTSPTGRVSVSHLHNVGAEKTSDPRRSGWKPNSRRSCRSPCPVKVTARACIFLINLDYRARTQAPVALPGFLDSKQKENSTLAGAEGMQEVSSS